MLLAGLGITKTHSRPHVSNDNPYSEAQFKTLKYRPGFPERFGCIEDSRAFNGDFFRWYNNEHHHTGLGRLRALPRVAGRRWHAATGTWSSRAVDQPRWSDSHHQQLKVTPEPVNVNETPVFCI